MGTLSERTKERVDGKGAWIVKLCYDGTANPVLFKDITASLIPQIVEKDPEAVYLDADLMGCIGTGKAAKDEPRMINCGIAEANMIGVACGLSASGFKPIVHSFGPFASRRMYDQVFLSGGYAGNSVTVLGSDPGVTAEFNGGTHMPFEDMALYTALPGAIVLDISDPAMLEDLLPKCVETDGVKYIRFPRKKSIRLYERGSHFEIGKAVELRDGTDAAIIACGIMVAKAMEAAELLKAKGVSVRVVDMFCVKPLDEEMVLRCAETGAIVTAENHNRNGGLTAAVSEFLAQTRPVPVEHVAVEDRFGEVGPQGYLEEQFGLTTDALVEKVLLAISRKMTP